MKHSLCAKIYKTLSSSCILHLLNIDTSLHNAGVRLAQRRNFSCFSLFKADVTRQRSVRT